MAMLSSDAEGVYVIAATPFTENGSVDHASIETLVDFYLRCGVHGMTILGVMGEFQKLSESETLETTLLRVGIRGKDAPSAEKADPPRPPERPSISEMPEAQRAKYEGPWIPKRRRPRIADSKNL